MSKSRASFDLVWLALRVAKRRRMALKAVIGFLQIGCGAFLFSCATMQTAVLRSARKTSGAGRVVRDKRIGGPVSGEFGDLSSPAPFVESANSGYFVLRHGLTS